MPVILQFLLSCLLVNIHRYYTTFYSSLCNHHTAPSITHFIIIVRREHVELTYPTVNNLTKSHEPTLMPLPQIVLIQFYTTYAYSFREPMKLS